MGASSPIESQEERKHSETESLPQFKVAGNRFAYKHFLRTSRADSKFTRLWVITLLLWVVILLQIAFLVRLMLMIQPINESLDELENRIAKLTQINPEQLSIQPDNLPLHITVTDEPQAVELGFRITTQDNQNIADGTVVHFEAVGGQIDPVTTTREGIAYTRFRPMKDSGDAIIVVSVGGAESAFAIPLTTTTTLDRIEIEADRTRLLANGEDTVQITIWAIGDHGHPMENVAIALQVEPGDAGSLAARDITTAGNGEMTVLFTAGTREGRVTIIAEAQDGSWINGTLELGLVSDLAELTVTPSETDFWNSGDAEARLGITLKDGLGNFVPGRLITLEIMGTAEAWFLGDDNQPITDANVTTRNTDANGATEVWCRLGETPGEVVIIARTEEQERQVTLNVGELGPSEIEIRADRTELAIDEQLNMSFTVRDQRGDPVPDVRVTLTVEPEDIGDIELDLVTGENGSAPVIFIARRAGQATITATVGENISESIILTIFEDSDGDGRFDNRERELGTDPEIADDKVSTEGLLSAGEDSRPILQVPVGVVLNRADFEAPEGYQAVRLQIWVQIDDLNWTKGERGTLKGGARILVGQEGFTQSILEAEQSAEGYPVRVIEGQVGEGWQLVEIEGLFPIANLNRP